MCGALSGPPPVGLAAWHIDRRIIIRVLLIPSPPAITKSLRISDTRVNLTFNFIPFHSQHCKENHSWKHQLHVHHREKYNTTTSSYTGSRAAAGHDGAEMPRVPWWDPDHALQNIRRQDETSEL